MIAPGAALVTGGAARLGRAMALALADDGWDVAVSYASSADEAEATAAEIRDRGRRAAALHADLLIEAEAGALASEIQKSNDAQPQFKTAFELAFEKAGLKNEA